MSVVLRDAQTVWNSLKGVICIYKPAGINCFQLRNTLIGKITGEMCELDCRPPEKRVIIEGEDTTKRLTVRIDTNYADHPLVVGPRYLPKDIKCVWSTYLGRNTSGVQIYGLKEGTRLARTLHMLHPIRTYKIKGQLGFSTDTLFIDGKIVEKAKYEKISRTKLDRWCAAMQASHQTKMFEQCGIDIQSETAYELAIKGPIRALRSDIPVVYGIKCTDFSPPEFTVEVQCVNENESYLKTLIHQLGYKLHSAATCTQIQCIRHSVFTLDDALLNKHWTLQHVLDNLNHCRKLIDKYRPALESSNLTILENIDVNNYDEKQLQLIKR